MENGRCWVHGGASTGPRTPEGRARVVAAMVEGRRKWVERRRAEGKKFPAGRKRGERWVTEPMRERARAEAHRLKGGRFTLDRAADARPARGARKAAWRARQERRRCSTRKSVRRWSGIVRRRSRASPNCARRYWPTHRRPGINRSRLCGGRALDLGDDANRLRGSRLCRLSAEPISPSAPKQMGLVWRLVKTII